MQKMDRRTAIKLVMMASAPSILSVAGRAHAQANSVLRVENAGQPEWQTGESGVMARVAMNLDLEDMDNMTISYKGASIRLSAEEVWKALTEGGCG